MTVTDPASTVVPPAGDLRRAMHVFIHDLRAPVGVAVGYLRLVRERRLPDEAARERVLEQAFESLGRLSRLCDDASGYLALHEAPAPAAGDVPADGFADVVAGRLAALGVAVQVDPPGAVPWRVAGDGAEVMSERLACLVTLSKRHAPEDDMTAHLTWRDGWLRLLVGTSQQRALLDSADPAPLDPWRGGLGLGPAAACLGIERHGGRVWTARGAWPGVGVALPLRVEAA